MGAERSCRLVSTARSMLVVNHSLAVYLSDKVEEFNRASTASTLYRSRHLARATSRRGSTMANYFHQHRTRHFSSRVLLIGAAGALSLMVVPAVAQAASPSGVVGRHAGAGKPTALATSICGKVSAASVSALIGYKVPAGVGTTFKIKPTKANFETTGTNTVCTYGAETSMATILKAVSLTIEVISKPITSAEMEQSLKAVNKIGKFTFVPYSGLGVPGFYFSLSESGITGQGIYGEASSTQYFGVNVESKSVSKSTLTALAKLAAKL
jgi:hypothetical protein